MPTRLDKNPAANQKKPPLPWETPAPMVKAESLPGNRLKKQKQNLRVLPLRLHQAGPLLIFSVSCLGVMKILRQTMPY